MTHLSDMLNRLPLLYREGELLAQVLGIPGLQLEILDEDALDVRRSHWFDQALELEDAAKLAAILDIPPENWQSLREYRIWVHTLRDAMLEDGAVTKRALQNFVEHYSTLYQGVTDIQTVPQFSTWSDMPSTHNPAFIENPLLRRFQRIPSQGGIEPLSQFSIEQKGLDIAIADFLLVGLPAGPESAPVIVNLTTQEALIFLGTLPPGQRLWIDGSKDGIRARLEDTDVTALMRSVSAVVPGTPWDQAQVKQPAQAITLARGRNDLWFLPVAHFDVFGLDRFLLALADIAEMQGRYDQAFFDHAIFYQEPAAVFQVSWVETQPASFRVELPGGTLLNAAGSTQTAMKSRDELGFSLDLAVKKLKAVGVASSVVMEPFQELQPQTDYLKAVLPMKVRDVGSVGADEKPDMGGLFEVTQFGESTFR